MTSLILTRKPRPARGFARRAATLLLVLGAGHQVYGPSLAHAQFGAPQSAAAQTLYEQGMAEMQAGNPAAACPKFEESQRLDPGTGTLLHLADCYEAVGRTASAWATFLEAAYAARSSGDSERQQVAEARAAALKARLSKVVIRVPFPRPSGLVVRNDGSTLGDAMWGVELPVDPGSHQVSAEAPGFERWVLVVEVPPGPGLMELEVPALVPAAAPAPPPSDASTPPPVAAAQAVATPRHPAYDNAGWWWVGAGGALALGGAGLVGWALHDDSVADSECRQEEPTECSARGVEFGDRANLKAGVGLASAGVGLAAVTTGVILLLTRDVDPQTTATWLAPAVASDRFGLAYGGAF